MPAIAFAAPLLPGRTDADREAMASCAHGARKAAYEDAHRRAGVTREAVWIQPTRKAMSPWSTSRPTISAPR